ncbi:hypothetical protein [Marinibacterium sp. SX1]|uniref:hypothetical protein n=1 Tax=Marinibacterium sp. SX1 TaxID=3388424 RepID=UPI003D176BDF
MNDKTPVFGPVRSAKGRLLAGVWRQAPAGPGLSLALCGALLAGSAAAECTVDGTDTLCTGEIAYFLARDFVENQAFTFRFSDLTVPISGEGSPSTGGLQTPAIGLSSTVTASGITLSFDGGTEGIDTAGHGIGILNQAPNGAAGEDAAHACPGKAGGTGGDIALTILSGDVKSTFDGNNGDRKSALWAAVLAESEGGSGGRGGKGLRRFGYKSTGGDGGKGGDGGDVTVVVTEDARLRGAGSNGLVAQSIGGKGGQGGDASSAVIGQAKGGKGGQGGRGGDVTVTAQGRFRAEGIAILARSLGGEGGSGGEAGGLFSEGGGSARAGAGGDVSVTLGTGTEITTRGAEALGILAQSIGGFAGEGGQGNGFVGYGGSGESGGAGGAVSLSMTDTTVTTSGKDSTGIVLESVGGGGGLGGKGGGVVALGGEGNAGGAGGEVMADLDQVTVTTTGEHAAALSALSLGGGGGMGGAGRGAAQVGGSGGSGGKGANVHVTTSGLFSTTGDVSAGIKLESTGGGGGSTYVTYGVLAIGADGGAGGAGGAVQLQNSATVSTEGLLSRGILLQSIGGGGGEGSAVVAVAPYLSVALGGEGGAGGDGGAVTYRDEADRPAGSVTTQGNLSSALVAQSVGGGGGSAGTAVSVAASWPMAMSLGASGSGGKGGSAGKVVIDTAADITTLGRLSAGIKALSQGGGGGDTGLLITPAAAPKGVDLDIALAGSAGVAGHGGAVSVTSAGRVTTEGVRADAIFAQSSGGGGGSANSASGGGLGVLSYGVSTSIGATGGKGGNGGAVSVEQSGAVDTTGDLSRGIFAQSVGGGGGDASSAIDVSLASTASASYTLGGTGGSGGKGGTVSVTSAGSVATAGDTATAIMAQSLGGGGGVGGLAGHGTIDRYTVNLAMGGKGGKGGKAGTAEVVVQDTVTTTGRLSHGVVAQSTGGGGGMAGGALGLAIGKAAVNLNLGGRGGNGGDGSTASILIDADGHVQTTGDGAVALMAQSVGGGGGVGNLSLEVGLAVDMSLAMYSSNGADGAGGTAQVTTEAGSLVETTGEDAVAVLAQSVGGGGGLVLIDIDEAQGATIDLGGISTNGDERELSAGGEVIVETAGTITTEGTRSHGILAQSVGAGGGAVLTAVQDADATVRVGGSKAATGDSGDVQVTNSGHIVTSGDQAAGIIAQGVGGGGGLGPNAMLAFSADVETLNMGYAVGGVSNGFAQAQHNARGNGGIIDVQTGAITTTGTAAHGVVAQSVGGGGGLAAVVDADGQVVAAMAGSVAEGGEGNARAVTVTVDGPVAVSGAEAHGIIAQSAAGTKRSPNPVSVTVTGSVAATGENGRGILAQSTGGKRNAAIVLEVAEGASVTTGEEGREAVLLLDGTDNTIDNAGVIATLGGFADADDGAYAIRAEGTDSATAVTNTGRISGAISGQGLSVQNAAGGVIEFGRENLLGGGLYSQGVMTTGEQGVVRRSRVTGSVEMDGGTLLVDHQLGDGADTGASADLLTLNGASTLTGEIRTQIVGVNLMSEGSVDSVDILRLPVSTRGEIDLSVADTAVIDYRLVESDASGIATYSLEYAVDYTPWQQAAGGGIQRVGAEDTDGDLAVPGGVNLGNAARFGDYLDTLVRARQAEIAAGGGSAYAWTEDLASQVLEVGDVETLLADYDMLVPNVHSAPLDANMLAAINFANALLSCPEEGAPGLERRGGDGACSWINIQGDYMTRDATHSTLGYSEQTFGLSAGFQAGIGADLQAGIGLSYEASHLSARNLSDGGGERVQLGLLVEKQAGPWVLGAGVTAGYGDYGLDRLTPTPDGVKDAHSDPRIGILSVHGRVARRFDLGQWYIEPRFDAGVHYQWRPGYAETGAGDYGVRFSDYDETALTLNPQLEIGGSVAPGTRAFLRAGVLGVVGGGREMGATFTGVPDGGPVMQVRDDPDDLFANIAVGFDAQLSDGWSMRIEAKSLLGENQRAFSGAARLQYRF